MYNFPIAKSATLVLGLVGLIAFSSMVTADPTCQWNKTDIDCSSANDSWCPSCNLSSAQGCSSWGPAVAYTGATDIYALNQVAQGEGEFQVLDGDPTAKQCWTEYPCTGDPVVMKECLAGGCATNQTEWCDDCSQGSPVPNVGTYTVYPLASCSGGS